MNYLDVVSLLALWGGSGEEDMPGLSPGSLTGIQTSVDKQEIFCQKIHLTNQISSFLPLKYLRCYFYTLEVDNHCRAEIAILKINVKSLHITWSLCLTRAGIFFSPSPLYLDVDNIGGAFFRASFCPPDPVFDSYHRSYGRNSSVLQHCMQSYNRFFTAKVQGERDCSSFCNEVYSVQLTVTFSGSAVSHTWCICNDYLRESFKNCAKVSACVRQAGEWRCFPER